MTDPHPHERIYQPGRITIGTCGDGEPGSEDDE